MKFAGNLDLQNNMIKNVVLEHHEDFPLNPKMGSFAFIKKRLMICLQVIDLVPSWIPLSQEMDTYLHSEPEASDTWVIPHNLGSSTVLVQCYDENNKVIIPDDIDLSVKDTAVISFGAAIAGRALIIMGNIVGLPKPEIRYSQSFTSNATWTVNHGLGYEPIVQCISDGKVLQPDSVTHPTTTQTVVTFSTPVSGKAICT